MGMDDMMKNEFFRKFIIRLARMLGEHYQEKAPKMSAEEIYEDQEFFPNFNTEKHNYLNKPTGYVCRSPRGNMVKLIQPYDSATYPADPEDLLAQWAFYWSKDPRFATEFVKSSTSPYNKDDCCVENGVIYRSLADNNIWAPSEYPTYWEDISTPKNESNE